MVLRLHRIALGIGTHIVEFRRRNTQVQHQHAIDSAQHGGFLFLQSGRLGAFGSKVAELEGVLFQFQRDEISHTGGILAAVRLRHGRLGHKAVFGNDVRHSGECAAIAQRMFQQPFHRLVVQRFVGSVDNALQEEVGFLQLVPKEGIYLRELESRETITCKGLGTHYIQPGEQPTTAGRLLVGDAFGIHLDRKMGIHILHILLVERQLADVVVADGIAQRLVGRRTLITLLNLAEHGRAYPALAVLRLRRKQCGAENNYR